MYHKTQLIGNLGRDPEMRYLPSGTPVTNFSVAAEDRWTDQNGEAQKRTVWYRVAVFGKAGEACNEYLHKGDRVFVEGRLNGDPETGGPRIWTGQDGQPRASFEITALTVKFLTGRGQGSRIQGDDPEATADEAEEEFPF